jgi:acetyl esterase/lipase
MAQQPIPLYPAGAPLRETVPNGETPRITPYPVDNPKPHGAVVVLPGGGYGGRAGHEGAPIAEFFNKQGIGAAVVDYRVSPFRHPVPLLDAQRAIRWVRANAGTYNWLPDKVAVLGFSAGGHLASTTLTHFDAGNADAEDPVERPSCRPDAVVLCYAVVTMSSSWTHEGSVHNLLGPKPSAELRVDLSAEQQVRAECPPTFLWHTADDQAVPVENSLMLAGALRHFKVPFELHVFPHGPHGMGLATGDPAVGQWPGLCAGWLKRQGWGA